MTDFAPFKDRRDLFAAAVADGFAVIPAGTAGGGRGFRQNSDFYALTGFEEPDAVAVLNPSHPQERFVLFVRPRDREREIWDGFRAGPEGAVSAYGADAAYPLDKLDAKLREYAVGAPAVHYRLGGRLDARVTSLVSFGRELEGRGLVGPSRIVDPSPALHEMRVLKSPDELEALRRACDISVDGHNEAMRWTRPGDHEYQVQAAMEFVWRQAGSPRNGYASIVGSGPNACILHYESNDRRIADGELVLIDAAAEYGYVTADVTRTFPANGSFTGAQRDVYEVVLAALRAATDAAEAGAGYDAMRTASTRVLAEGLVELGAMPRGLDDVLAMHLYREFTVHSTGHFLGRDVHDVGATRRDGAWRALEPGMVVTIEPGLYFHADVETVTFHLREHDLDDAADRRTLLGAAEAGRLEREEKERAQKVEHRVPEHLRGIGVRIEDDVLVTAEGPDVLTSGCPKAADDVEAMCREAPRLPR